MRKSDYVDLARFRALLRRFLRVSEERARLVGLTPQQHQLLLAIKGQPEREWASVSELAESLQITHHATVGLVDRCEKQNMVRRDPDPDDRRLVRVSLTPHGTDVLEELSAQNRAELQVLKQALNSSFLNEAGHQ